MAQTFADLMNQGQNKYVFLLPEKRMGGYGARLLKAFEQWCKNRQVVEINFGINSLEDATEMQRLGSFARRMGYAKVGENFTRLLA